ncbi:hypothetical protein [Raoultella terrigena]|uniref:hypothetical protein n=1 Tax=Raoultella terrigena TaxID=577 RepID=UPI003BAA57B7
MALVVTGADFFRGPPLSEFMLFDIMNSNPAKEGLLGSYFLGSRNADPTYNFANPSLPLLAVGDIPTQSKYATLSRSGYYDTGIPSETNITIIALSRQPSSGATGITVSSYLNDASGTTGDTLMDRWSGADAQVAFYAQSSATAVTQAARNTDVSAGEFHVYGALISGLAIGAWTMSEASDPGHTDTLMTGRGVSSRTLRMGTTYSESAFLTASIDLSAALIYNGNIGSANMTAVMNWLRNVVGVEAGIWTAAKA